MIPAYGTVRNDRMVVIEWFLNQGNGSQGEQKKHRRFSRTKNARQNPTRSTRYTVYRMPTRHRDTNHRKHPKALLVLVLVLVLLVICET